MVKNPFDPQFEDLPEEIPLFPLDGALLLPRGELPLNIFEPRYLAMVADALKTNRLIGIVQPDFRIGCVGRIVSFEETADGRYLIGLRGLCRFRLSVEKRMMPTGYGMAKVFWDGFESDMDGSSCPDIDRPRLRVLLEGYFSSRGLEMDWDLLDEVEGDGLMATLAMVCPLPSPEKQALLEARCCQTRADLLMKLIEIAIAGQNMPRCGKCH